MTLKIMLVDDHAMVRNGLRFMFENIVNAEVIAEAADGRMAVNHAIKIKPDIVIMDIAMKDLNGIEATRQIVAQNPDIKVIALSMHSDSRFVRGALQAGAVGYLLKDSQFGELEKAVSAVMDNDIYLCPEITTTVVKEYLNKTTNDEQPLSTQVLTPREREVLQLLAEGHSVQKIASILHISRKTVESHRRKIKDKLNIHNVADLIKYAIREGLSSL
jgi:two-component system response regulator NreC